MFINGWYDTRNTRYLQVLNVTNNTQTWGQHGKHPDICIMYYGSNKNNRPSYNAKKRYNW